MEKVFGNVFFRKLFLVFGRKARRKIAVILGCCVIYLLILLNWQFVYQNIGQDRSVSKHFQNIPMETYFVNDIQKGFINVTEISQKIRLNNTVLQNTALKQSPIEPDRRSHKTPHTNSRLLKTTLRRLYPDWSSITLKPNFSKMINASQTVSTIDTPYILENKNVCSSVKNLSMLIIFHTATNHIERRKLIRATWANSTFYLALGNFRRLFLLGKPWDVTIQKRIEEESKQYGDILQGDFVDSYRNLTLKGVMAYKWLTERCRNAKFILKVDDDIFVNVFKLFTDILPKYSSKPQQIICNHITENTMPIIRKNDSKWFVHQNHFRGRGLYPTDYCSGFLVIFTNDLMPAFYSSAKVTPFFWVDDVYLYGLVPGNVPGVKYNGMKGQWHQLYGQEALKCFRNITRTCDFLAIGTGGKGEIPDIWPHVVKQYYLPI